MSFVSVEVGISTLHVQWLTWWLDDVITACQCVSRNFTSCSHFLVLSMPSF